METISAEARRRGISRQRVWQERKRARGMCCQCGNVPVPEGRSTCDYCCAKRNQSYFIKKASRDQ